MTTSRGDVFFRDRRPSASALTSLLPERLQYTCARPRAPHTHARVRTTCALRILRASHIPSVHELSCRDEDAQTDAKRQNCWEVIAVI
eukprot:5526322-Pleurochrysis_carterae.AAC.1